MPIYCRPSRLATAPVVPLPKNGSNTTPPTGHPARMHGSTNRSGNMAKCPSILYELVLRFQTYTHTHSVSPRLEAHSPICSQGSASIPPFYRSSIRDGSHRTVRRLPPPHTETPRASPVEPKPQESPFRECHRCVPA